MTGIDGDRDEEFQAQPWNAGEEDEALETERLALDDGPGEGRLPWLKSAEDDYEDEEEQGPGRGRLIVMMVLALLVLGGAIGGIWWFTHRGAGNAPAADGSLVAAPAAPYKEAPKDPGGKTFAGTGDSSFAVSEGQTRPAQLAQASSAPAPVPAPVAKPAAAAPAPVAARPAPAPAPAQGGVGVQVGAFSTREGAETGWTRLAAQASSLLGSVPHRVVAGTTDSGTVYRLQAVAGDAAQAQALCGKLKAVGIPCQVK